MPAAASISTAVNLLRRSAAADHLLALAAGLLLALSFPRIGWSGCAWFALAPLLAAIATAAPSRSFVLGWEAGMAFHLATLYWVATPVAGGAGVSPWIAAGAPLLLAAALSVVFGAFSAGVRFWETRTGRPSLVLAAALWVALEWARSTFGLPFPWNALGYSQASNTDLLQMTEVTGIYGVSALVVAVNAVTAAVLLGPRRDLTALARRLAAVTLVVFVAQMAGSARRSGVRSAAGEHRARIGFVQPSIPQRLKWEAAAREATLDVEEALSLALRRERPALVVWPETAVPYVFASDAFYDREPEAFAADRRLRDRMLAFVRELGSPLLFGGPAIEIEPRSRGEVWNSLNRAFLLSPDGRVEAVYDKMILVPFGEYVPSPRVLFFLRKLVPGAGSFVPGREATLFSIPEGRFGVLICYEAIFPDFARRFVARGAGFLVNLTNDGWLGDGSGPDQHLAMARVRAIENRVPLVRVANGGISAVVDPDGTLRAVKPLFRRAADVVEVRWDERATFYTRHGDVFAELASLAAAAMIVYAGWITRAPDPSPVGLAE